MGIFDSNKTSNAYETTNNDNRQVITNTTSNLDLSDRSVDSSIKNTSTNINYLDGGAVGAMRDVAIGSMEYGDSLFDKATMALNSALKSSESAWSTAAGIQKDALLGAKDAFAVAARQTADAYKNSDNNTKTAYATAMESATAAYADAKGTTNAQKSIIMGVLAVAGLMALVLMNK